MVGTDSLHHPELCNKKLLASDIILLATFDYPETSGCWEHPVWSLTASGLEPGTKREDVNSLGNKDHP